MKTRPHDGLECQAGDRLASTAGIVIMGIDAALGGTGIATVDDELRLISITTLYPQVREDGGQFARIVDIANQVAEVVTQVQPHFVYAEDTYAGPNRNTNKVLARLSGAIAHSVAIATSGAIEVALMTPSEWRRRVGISSKAEVASAFDRSFPCAQPASEDAQEAALIALAGIFEIRDTILGAEHDRDPADRHRRSAMRVRRATGGGGVP